MRRAVWGAKIAVCIQHASSEYENLDSNIKTRSIDMPFIIGASRVSYLPLLIPRIRNHFEDLFDGLSLPVQTHIWFSWEGFPLSWHYPIGHLFDECSVLQKNSKPGVPIALPWTLSFHIKEYGNQRLMLPVPRHLCLEESVGAHFYSMIKQADYLRNGCNRGIQRLSTTQQAQLWDGLLAMSFALFDPSYQVLVGSCSLDQLKNWRSLPIRMYILRSAGGAALNPFESNLTMANQSRIGGINANVDINCENLQRKVIQKLISIQNDNLKLSDLLQIPIYSQISRNRGLRAVSHGVIIPAETPISWLIANFCYPDGFLHLILF